MTGLSLSITASAGLQVDLARRTIRGTLYRIGEVGGTSAGPLRVEDINAITVPTDLSAVTMVREHERGEIRGHLALLDDNPERRYVAIRVVDGPEGDAALAEAISRERGGLSFDIEDALVSNGVIVRGRLVSIGQVKDPAFNSARIDQIAAAQTSGTSRANEGESMNPEQIARLAELLGLDTRTPEEETELQALVALLPAPVQAAEPEPTPAPAPTTAAAPAPEPVTASVPAVPAGVPVPTQRPGIRAAATTSPQGANAFDTMISGLVQAFQLKRRNGDPMPGITAALNDVISTGITEDIEPLAWSGELFSGLPNEQFFDIYETGPLENWEGKGWRFTNTPAIADYAGDKAEIPTGTVGTQESLWEAARGAVGIDIDRKFFDFPNGEFLAGLFREMGSTWLDLLDTKRRLYTVAEAVSATRPVTVHTTNADATVTAPANQVAAIDIGQAISGVGIPGGATVLSITNPTTFEISANATATGDPVAQIAIKSPSLLKAAARVGMSLNRPFGNIKRPSSSGADWLLMNDEDHYQLLDLVEDKLPAYLTLFGIEPENFRTSPDLARGFIYGGVKKAAKVRTESRSPIAVDAMNLANGGIDKAFFGYWAIEKQHLRGVQKVAFSQVVEA